MYEMENKTCSKPPTSIHMLTSVRQCCPENSETPCRTGRRFPALRMGSNINTKTWDTGNHTHMLHVWYIYLHLGDFWGKWSIWDKIPGSSNFPKGKMGILAKHLPV